MKPLKARLDILALLTLAVATLAVFHGCGVSSLRFGTQFFRHDVHAAQKIDCDACHDRQEPQAEPGMPTYRRCLPCHGPSPYRQPYPYEKKIQENNPDVAFEPSPRAFDLKFSHLTHSRQGIDCTRCHLDPTAFSDIRRPTPDTCQDCHREHGLTASCSLCHEGLSRDVAPPSHSRETWRRTHGRTVLLGLSSAHKENCGLCHSTTACNSCHQREKPADHTEFFRLRGHGLQVSISRERCATCHQQSSCIRCHEETRPRSHSGLWGGSRSTHCLKCHESLGTTSCVVCHRATPSHQQATAIPPPPHAPPTSDCRVCHLRPPHADNGMSCTYCHK